MTSPAHMPDPRRVIITFHTQSRSPRARRWYSLCIACEFDGELFEHRALDAMVPVARRKRSEAIKVAKALAEALGYPFVPGLWRGPHGYPMTREG